MSFNKNKIGIGIITCNRQDFFRKCIKSIPDSDCSIVVNDGTPYPDSEYPKWINNVVQNEKNLGVGKSKNIALRYLISQDCDHIFLCEDDISIQDTEIYDHYIRASRLSGIQHFNYAYHGNGNRNMDGIPLPRKILSYNNISVSFNRNLLGAFSYFSILSLKSAGLIDERFKNAWEHVDHTYQIIKINMHPPFWWFSDVANSYELISDLHQNHSLSVIRKSNFWKLNLRYNAYLFKLKNGYFPTHMPEADEKELSKKLNEIKSALAEKLK